jgi:hypothetical protein
VSILASAQFDAGDALVRPQIRHLPKATAWA